MKSILSLPKKTLAGKKVLVRVDFNEPVLKGRVRDDFRIKKTMPLIRELQKRRARVILASHFEMDGKTPTLLPVANYLKKHGLPKVKFVSDVAGPKAKAATDSLKEGEVLLLENLRRDSGEKKNSAALARRLASLADIYVNEAFSASHRRHASIIGVPKYLPSYAGPLFLDEINALKKALKPPRPFLFVLGGKKISTKIGILKKMERRADAIMVAGAMANNFYKALGAEIGKSYFEKDAVADAEKFLDSDKILLPGDVVVLRSEHKKTVSVGEIKKDDIIYDMGSETLRSLVEITRLAKFVIWNGPLGYIEGGYDEATKKFARALALHSFNEGGPASLRATSIVGGGDTIAFLHKLKLLNKFSFVSTGGGAMLDFLAEGTLPGIEALE